MGSRQAILLRKLRESTLPDTPYMSPLRASDEVLRQFPTTYLIVSRCFFLSFVLFFAPAPRSFDRLFLDWD